MLYIWSHPSVFYRVPEFQNAICLRSKVANFQIKRLFCRLNARYPSCWNSHFIYFGFNCIDFIKRIIYFGSTIYCYYIHVLISMSLRAKCVTFVAWDLPEIFVRYKDVPLLVRVGKSRLWPSTYFYSKLFCKNVTNNCTQNSAVLLSISIQLLQENKSEAKVRLVEWDSPNRINPF